MSFEIKYNKNGALFHVIIPRDVTGQEAHELAQLALNITKLGEENNEPNGRVYGPELPPGYQRIHPPMLPSSDDLVTHIRNGNAFPGVNAQTKLGERPTTEANLMSYKEPKEGVRIKMLAFPEGGTRVKAIWSVRNNTGISLKTAKDIVFGNLLCPILQPEVAEKIMNDFRSLEVYAKVVPADNRTQAA